jgi:V/A-type H+-transporting ATPase subunit I
LLVLVFAGQAGVGWRARVRDALANAGPNVFGLIGCFGDVVSYLRLFAVGLATKEVAVAFNDLALQLGLSPVWSGVGLVLVLFLGHSVNLMLAVLSVLVHGVRLNVMEFSNHLSLTWAGTPFVPFRLGSNPN